MIIDSCHQKWRCQHSPGLVGRFRKSLLIIVLPQTTSVCRDRISTESPSNIFDGSMHPRLPRAGGSMPVPALTRAG